MGTMCCTLHFLSLSVSVSDCLQYCTQQPNQQQPQFNAMFEEMRAVDATAAALPFP